MAIDQDVLVVGGGLAGMTAAIAAARTGARTRLVSHKQSTLRQASGLIDVLGYVDGDGPVADPFEALADLPDNHPYATVGRGAVEAGLALFDGIVGEQYRGSHTNRNALVPTAAGTVKPTARYPAATAAGLANDDRAMLLVGLAELPDFDAPRAAAHLESTGLPASVRGVTVDFPVEVSADATVTRFAHLLDGASADGGTTGKTSAAADGPGAAAGDVRGSLADRISRHLDGESRVGLPAVLGLDAPEEVRHSLADRLGVDIFEIPMGPPSVPGMRLEAIYERALSEADVLVETGNAVVGVECDSDQEDDQSAATAALVDRQGSEIPYAASQFVLATGGLVGQGIASDRETVHEPVFDCHVAHPEDRMAWSEPSAFGDHAFPRFGVETDDRLRPLDANGRPEFDNLRAAGAVLSGYDFAAEKSGAGVSLATGYRAGSLAGENA